jgi:hypothetical protein
MACYAPFYQDITGRIASENASTGKPTVIVEAGVRHGCSARIFLEALKDCDTWDLFLIDPEPKEEALVLTANPHVKLMAAKAESVASGFADGSVDLLHIDADINGDHDYHLALLILTAFWRKLKPRGEVIFHDCTPRFPGIVRLVKELEDSGQWDVSYGKPDPASPISAPAHTKRRFLTKGVSDITVVIPVIQDKFLGSLLKDIHLNTVKPSEIIVIDNGNGVCEKTCLGFSQALPIRYLKRETNIGVNASWNLGIEESRTELVSVLNDDLVLPGNFFSLVQETFDTVSNAGMVIPSTIGPPVKGVGVLQWTVGTPHDLVNHDDAPEVSPYTVREGWAFTVKKSFVEPIPSTMFTFCGDDWLFHQVRKKGYWTLKITNNHVFHYVGISLNHAQRQVLNLPTVDEDRKAWNAVSQRS